MNFPIVKLIHDYSYSKTNQMHQCIKCIYFRMTLYMFRTVFPSINRSSRLYIQQQAFVKQTAVSVLSQEIKEKPARKQGTTNQPTNKQTNKN